MSTRDQTTGDVSKEDLRNTLQSFQDGLRGQVDDRRSLIVTTGIVLGVALVVMAYLLGRRGGRRRSTLVELRRI